jgi:hypothetical protein
MKEDLKKEQHQIIISASNKSIRVHVYLPCRKVFYSIQQYSHTIIQKILYNGSKKGTKVNNDF